ncbi:hypothetical protein KI387_033357, partial [Taxus chinensis]
MEIEHVKGKENVVANALSRWRHVIMATSVGTYLRSRILQQVPLDNFYIAVQAEVKSHRPLEGKFDAFSLETNGIIRHRGWIYVPIDGGLRLHFLIEAHHAPYSAHPGVKKMHATLRQ